MIKESKLFDFEKKWTKRKLRNVSIDTFRNAVIEILKANTTESQFNLIEKKNKLIAAHLCDNHSYTRDDFNLIMEGSKVYNKALSLSIRKLIDQYEEANNIKTIWEDEVVSNMRSQHFKISIHE